MNIIKQPRDGSFVVIFSGQIENWQEMRFLLGCNINDGLFELLGGGFDISDTTPDVAACREIFEETMGTYILENKDLTYFSHMIQKIPHLGKEEKGHVFCFFIQNGGYENFNASNEHNILTWHKTSDILEKGENEYRTSTLKIIFHFFNYLLDKKFKFGILRDKVKFMNYEF